jgi:uncharacterized membrane protein
MDMKENLAVVLLIALAALPVQALAYYGGDLTVTQQVSQVCPCRIVSSSEITVKLTNFGTKSDTFFLSVTVPEGWSGFIEPQVTLASGETVTIDPSWVSPPCGTLPGRYTVKFSAQSAMSGKVDFEEVVIDVLACHSAEIHASGFAACEGEETAAKASLANTGDMDDVFDVTVVSPSWVTVQPSSLSISELSSAAFTITASPPEGSSGMANITLKASSRNTYASDEKTIALNVRRCTYFTATLVPPQDSVCLGESTDYYISIDNKGTRDDRYRIIVPSFAVASEETVSIGAGERKTVRVTVTPPSAGQKDIEVFVSSLNYPTNILPVEGIVSVLDCRDASLSLGPPQLSACIGSKASFTATLANTGNVPTSYGTRFIIGSTSSSEKVTLAPGESQEISVDVDTSAVGKYPVAVEASVGNRTVAFDSAVLSVERCYDAALTLPPSGTVCQGDAVSISVSVVNTGTMKDYYTLSYPAGTKNFTLASDQKTDIVLSFTADYPWGSRRNATFTLRSENGVTAEGRVLVSTLSKDACYSVGVPVPTEPSASGVGEEEGSLHAQVIRGRGVPAAVVIKNAGERPDTYTLSLSGPDWAYLSTKEMTLAPGENATAYVYLSPPYDAKEATYNITVIAESENVLQRILLRAAVADSFPDDGSSSAGGSGLSGMIIGSAIASQAMVLSIMAILTVVIVAMRFVIYK